MRYLYFILLCLILVSCKHHDNFPYYTPRGNYEAYIDLNSRIKRNGNNTETIYHYDIHCHNLDSKGQITIIEYPKDFKGVNKYFPCAICAYKPLKEIYESDKDYAMKNIYEQGSKIFSDLGSFLYFKNRIQDYDARKTFYYAARDSLDLGSWEDFNEYIGMTN